MTDTLVAPARPKPPHVVDGLSRTVRARERLRGRTGSVVALTAIVLGAAAFHGAYAAGTPAPWIIPDELLYSELAKSLGGGDGLAIRGEATFGVAFGYPLVVSPVFAVFSDVAVAYTVVKLVNSFVMSLAAIPVFLLARRVTTRGEAFALSFLAVALPSMVYTSLVMSEVLFYPAFLCVILTMARCLERPTWARQFWVVAAIAGAALVRPQALILLPAFAVSAAASSALEAARRPGSRFAGRILAGLRKYAPAGAAFSLVFVAYGLLQVLRDSSPLDTPGIYGGLLSGVPWADVPRWLAYQFLELNLYVAATPILLAGLAIVGAFRSARRDASQLALRSLAVVSVSVSLLMFVMVAAFSAKNPGYFVHPPAIHERYLFYLVPLCLILAFVGLRTVRSIRGRYAGGAVATLALLSGLIPFERLRFNANFETLAILPYLPFREPIYGRLFAIAVTATIAFAALAAARRQSSGMFVLLSASYFFLMTVVARIFVSAASAASAAAGFSGPPTWIDRAVQRGDVAVVWSQERLRDGRQVEAAWRTVWESEFFNRRVATVYHLDEPMPYGLPALDARVDGDGTVVSRGSGAPIRAEYVLALDDVLPAGEVIARDARAGLAIVRTSGTVRLAAERSPRG